MSEFHEALRSHLLDDSEVRKALGPRIFHSVVPPRRQGQKLRPLVVYTITDDTPELWLQGETGTGRSRIQYTVEADTAAEGRRIKHLLRRRLNGLHNATIDGVRIKHCLLQTSYEVDYDPELGREIPPFAEALEFDVLHTIEIADPQPAASGGGTGGSGGAQPPPAGVSYFALTGTDEMTAQYGSTTNWDVGASGNLSYATPSQFWFGDYYFLHYRDLSNGTITDRISGAPQGVSILNGTLERIKAVNPAARVWFYTTLMREGTTVTLADEGAWPQTRAIIADGLLPAWRNPACNTPGDAYDEEVGIDYLDAACREYHGREWARVVARMKDLHPLLDGVFSDNFAMNQVSPASPCFNDNAVMNLAASGVNPLQGEFGKAMPLVVNITTRWQTDLRGSGYLDLAANSGVAGFHNEGLAFEHHMTVAEFDNIVANQRAWLGKSWIGGGRRGLFSNARNGGDFAAGLTREITVSAVDVEATRLLLTLASPHYLSDSSYWHAFTTDLHPSSVDGTDYQVEPHASDPTKLYLLTGSGRPSSGYTPGSPAKLNFLFSGKDIDAAWLHSIRRRGDAVRATHIYNSADSRGYSTPIWRNWAATYGYATGLPIVVSTHNVTATEDYIPGVTNLPCVKEIKTPFGETGSWYLHIDFSRAARRAWWEEES